MPPVQSTYKLLVEKILGRVPADEWIDWALEMLDKGVEGEYLYILAGISPPYYSSEVDAVVTKALSEAGVVVPGLETAALQYEAFLVEEGLVERMDLDHVIAPLYRLYNELDMHPALTDFFLLYFAREDLKTSEQQWYLPQANRSNIDEVTREVLRGWMKTYGSTRMNSV